MSTRLGAALVLAVLSAAAPAYAEDPYAGVLNGPAMGSTALDEAVQAMQGCTSEACEALRDVWRAIDARYRRDRPNSLTRLRPLRPTEWQQMARHAEDVLHQTLLTHKERFGLYCAVLTKVAGRYSMSDPYPVYASLEFATRMDARRDRHDTPCTRRMIAALPSQPDVDGPSGVISLAREHCVNNHRPGCAAMSRPRP